MRKKYESKPENDFTALPLVRQYIIKAKREKDYLRLVQGYKDGILYSSKANDKLKYSDSTIWASKLTRNNDQISRAYLAKGVVYYFNFKKYQLALDEYLKAYEYSKNVNDGYHKNRLMYHIAVVKSYIGYYDESLVLFKQTSAFFEAESKKNIHPNLIHDNLRGYYNSLHQMIVCYRNLGNYRLADSLINIGLLSTSSNEDFLQEYGYFLKEKGIWEFCKREYKNSIRTLKRSVESIANVNDFAWASVCYSYIAKCYVELGDKNMAVRYFQKVDSVFQQHGFILPELRSNYEQLINQYKKQRNTQKELYYTKQLLKADKVISQDFSYLFHKIYKEYDTRTLLEEKVRLEKRSVLSNWVSISLAVFALFLVIFSLFTYRTKRQIHEEYSLLEQKILARNEVVVNNNPINIRENNKLDIEKKIVDDLILKLQGFEERLEFTESGITLNKLAVKFDTNQNYLSQVVNDYKGVNFTRYLSELRIAFITDKLYNDKKYLRYKIETLAEECGIASRANFSNLFQEINGMRPTDFIKKRLADVDDEKNREVSDRS